MPCHALNEITFSLDQVSLNDLGLWCLKDHHMSLPPEPFQRFPCPTEKGKLLIKVGSIGEDIFRYLRGKNQAVEGHLLNIFSLIYS